MVMPYSSEGPTDPGYFTKDGLNWERLKAEHDERLLSYPDGAVRMAASKENAKDIMRGKSIAGSSRRLSRQLGED